MWGCWGAGSWLVVECCAELLSHVRLFVTPWTLARQAPLYRRFSSQEHWSGLPCPPPGHLPNPGTEPMSPALPVDSYQLSYQGSPWTLEWVAYPFSRESSWSRNRTGVSPALLVDSYQLSYQGSPGGMAGAVQSLGVTLDCFSLVVVLFVKVLFCFVSGFIKQLRSYPVLNLLLSIHSQVYYNSILNYLFSRGWTHRVEYSGRTVICKIHIIIPNKA